jgi:predicted GTPase
MNYSAEGKLQIVLESLRIKVSGLLLNRTPRLVVIGRRGAGKTSMLNAIFGSMIGQIGSVEQGTINTAWTVHQILNGGRIEILDTMGLQAPVIDEITNSRDLLLDIIDAVKTKKPDIFLFLVKAKEVDAAIDKDIDTFSQIIAVTKKYYKTAPSAIVVISQCDELDPVHIVSVDDRNSYPEDWLEKQANIYASVQTIRKHIEKRTDLYSHVIGFIPISAYVRFRRDGTVDPDPRADYRWNIKELTEIIFGILPR